MCCPLVLLLLAPFYLPLSCRRGERHETAVPDRGPLTHSQMPPKSTQFGRTALPFLAMMGLGSWGLAQFLKMPIDVKDARAKDKREKKEKFDLAKEHEVRSPNHAAPERRCAQMHADRAHLPPRPALAAFQGRAGRQGGEL